MDTPSPAGLQPGTPTIDKNYMIGMNDGVFQGTTEDDLKALVTASAGKSIVFHAHGGLVDADAAILNANNLLGGYLATGAYPVFPIWHTGFLETVARDWIVIAKSVLARALGDKVQEIVKNLSTGSNLGLDSVSLGGPIEDSTDWQYIQDHAVEYAQTHPDPALEAEFQKVLQDPSQPETFNVSVDRNRERELLRPEIVEKASAPSDQAGDLTIWNILVAAGEVAAAVAGRYLKGTAHPLQATVWEEVLRYAYVDTIGGDVWSAMTQASVTDCGATAPIGKFFKLLKAQGEQELYLIGHSAGAIMICDILDTLYGADVAWQGGVNVIFLAPAATHLRFEQALQKHGPKIKQFRMFTMLDAHEKVDTLLAGINGVPEPVATLFYPSSLLYFICGLLDGQVDEPLVGMQWFYGAQPNGTPRRSQTVFDFVTAVGTSRVAWSIYDGPNPKMETNALHHGDFGSPLLRDGTVNTTITSICEIVKNGF